MTVSCRHLDIIQGRIERINGKKGGQEQGQPPFFRPSWHIRSRGVTLVSIAALEQLSLTVQSTKVQVQVQVQVQAHAVQHIDGRMEDIVSTLFFSLEAQYDGWQY